MHTTRPRHVPSAWPMNPSPRRGLLSLGIAALLGTALGLSPLACNGISTSSMTGDPPDSTGDGGSGGDGGGQSGYCAGSGPPIVVGDSGTAAARCSGQVAASAFRYGLCVCQDLSASSTISVDAFDSSMPGATTLGSGGSVGINNNINVSATLSVGGALQSGGGSTGQVLSIGQDLLLGAGMNQSQVTVGRNAQVNGDVIVANALRVTGSLTVPVGRTLNGNPVQAGSTVRAAVSVGAPCDCGNGQLFPIASYVEGRRSSNDNARIGLSPDRLTNFSGAQTLAMPCGRFFLDRITGSGSLTIQVSGRTALFVGGDVNLQDSFRVQVGGSGELDLFINGGLTSSAPLNFGDSTAPARVRLYMGGSRNINLAANSVINGNIYAPESALVTAGALTVYGALFVRSFNPSSTVTIHHDVAVLKASDSCTPTGGSNPPTPGCTRCQDCGGQSCNGGFCGACTQDSDCCRPLSCDRNGKCAYIIG